MTETVVSWNEVRRIHVSFGNHFGAGNKQGDLNDVFTQTLLNIASLFIIDNDGFETLQPDPIPTFKPLVVAVIVDELPKATGDNKFETNVLVLSIHSWEFHINWYPYEFHKLKFNSKLIDQFRQEQNGETILALPPKRKHQSKHMVPFKPIEPKANWTVQVSAKCTSSHTATNPNDPVVSHAIPVPYHPASIPSSCASVPSSLTVFTSKPPSQSCGHQTTAPSPLPGSGHHSAPPWRISIQALAYC
eukprot:jgi/Psemu1/31565/gm1.31565_g